MPELEPEPAMETVDLGASADASVQPNPEDDFAGFSTGKKKKGKKGKVRSVFQYLIRCFRMHTLSSTLHMICKSGQAKRYLQLKRPANAAVQTTGSLESLDWSEMICFDVAESLWQLPRPLAPAVLVTALPSGNLTLQAQQILYL